MIDLKAELCNFQPINLDSWTERGREIPDNIRNAVVLYNKALENLRSGSEDIAIIGLKKAISIYPEFYEAINLLGVCYAYIQDYEKATEMFQRVTKAENNGLLAVNYLRKINAPLVDEPVKLAEKNNEKSEKKIRIFKKQPERATNKSSPSFNPFSRPQYKSDNKKIAEAFAVGVILTGIISYIIFTNISNSLTYDQNRKAQDSSINYKQLEQKYIKLKNDYTELKKLYEAANNEVNYYRVTGKLAEAEKLLSEREYEQAADILIQLKEEKLKEPESSKCSQLLQKCIPQACQAVYNNGIQLFNNGKFSEAAAKLSKLLTYDKNYRYLDYALYCLGKCYEKLNNTQSAIEAFQAVIDKYPGTEYAVWSKNRINEIKSRQ